jgi:hypothetical protein
MRHKIRSEAKKGVSPVDGKLLWWGKVLMDGKVIGNRAFDDETAAREWAHWLAGEYRDAYGSQDGGK